MTTREDLPHWDREDLSYGPDDWFEDSYDDTFVHWDEPAAAVRRPWHRNPGILIGLIAASSAALSVASVLLVAGNTPVDSPARLRPVIRSTAVPEPPPQMPAEASTPVAAPELPGDEPTAEVQAAEVAESDVPVALVEESAPNSAAPPPRDTRGESADSEGPRINVTRNPMSFTPGAIG